MRPSARFAASFWSCVWFYLFRGCWNILWSLNFWFKDAIWLKCVWGVPCVFANSQYFEDLLCVLGICILWEIAVGLWGALGVLQKVFGGLGGLWSQACRSRNHDKTLKTIIFVWAHFLFVILMRISVWKHRIRKAENLVSLRSDFSEVN
jgi:hypothetical protein